MNPILALSVGPVAVIYVFTLIDVLVFGAPMAVLWSPRGVGISHRVEGNFILNQLRLFAIAFVVEYTATRFTSINPALVQRPDASVWECGVFWGVSALCAVAVSSWARIQCAFCAASLVGVGLLGQNAEGWPPAFGSLKDAHRLRLFWGRVWHQFLRRFLVRAVGRNRIFPAFVLSGMIHGVGEWLMCGTWTGSVGFWTLQAVGIALEERLALSKGFGYVWTGTWLLLTAGFITHTIHQMPRYTQPTIDLIAYIIAGTLSGIGLCGFVLISVLMCRRSKQFKSYIPLPGTQRKGSKVEGVVPAERFTPLAPDAMRAGCGLGGGPARWSPVDARVPPPRERSDSELRAVYLHTSPTPSHSASTVYTAQSGTVMSGSSATTMMGMTPLRGGQMPSASRWSDHEEESGYSVASPVASSKGLLFKEGAFRF